MTTRFLIGDVFERLAEIPDGSVDLVVTSPPFLALRSYLPADHPDKGREIGSEPTPAAFIDVMLAVTAELRRVLAPHGSIAVELGDTYSAGAPGWPRAKSLSLIPSRYMIALADGEHNGNPSPAGRWIIRNDIRWCRPNPPVGALGDKWRPATSDVVVACTSDKRYWDDLATRQPHQYPELIDRPVHVKGRTGQSMMQKPSDDITNRGHPSGAPLLDYWVIPPKGYSGAHYAVMPSEVVVPLVKAMCPQKVCRVCGEPSRRITQTTPEYDAKRSGRDIYAETGPTDRGTGMHGSSRPPTLVASEWITLGFTDCGHDNWRPGVVLDPFAGSGTTLAVAHGHGHDSVGIDLDDRNAELAQGRLGLFLEVES